MPRKRGWSHQPWSNDENKVHKQEITREELNERVKDFLRKGGEIKKMKSSDKKEYPAIAELLNNLSI